MTVVVVLAAWRDVRTGKIPNAVTFRHAGVRDRHAALDGAGRPIFSLTGLGAGLTFLLIPHLFGYLGAGDVKLMAVVGAALGLPARSRSFCSPASPEAGSILGHLALSRRDSPPAEPSGDSPDAPPAVRTGTRRIRYGAAIALGNRGGHGLASVRADYLAFF